MAYQFEFGHSRPQKPLTAFLDQRVLQELSNVVAVHIGPPIAGLPEALQLAISEPAEQGVRETPYLVAASSRVMQSAGKAVPGSRDPSTFWRALSGSQWALNRVPSLRDPLNRRWWWFGERFFYEDQNYSAKDVQALIIEAERKHDRQLSRAHEVMALEDWDLFQRREPIPEDVQRAIWQRDGGRCVKCGSNLMFHIDHMIPVALGGSNHPDNLQLLCASCNREKSDSI